MLPRAGRNFQFVDFLRGDLFRVGAEHEMHFIRLGVDLVEQALEIKCAAGAGGGEDEFHSALQNHKSHPHSSDVRGRVSWPVAHTSREAPRP